MVDTDHLAQLLAARLASIVPDGFHVAAADGMLWYSADEGRFPGQSGRFETGRAGTHLRDNFGTRGETIAEHITAAAWQALDELQDYIDEATNDPWPGVRTVPPAQAQIRGEALHLWYGEPGQAAVLACEPIPLAGLIGRPA